MYVDPCWRGTSLTVSCMHATSIEVGEKILLFDEELTVWKQAYQTLLAGSEVAGGHVHLV